MELLDAAATRARLPAAALLAALAEAMRARRAGALRAPERTVLPLTGGASYLAMPAADELLAVTKLITVHPENPARGLPAIRGQLLVADARDGRPLLALDGPTVTARRTAAVTALALRRLRRRPVRAVALVGTGVQALEHARLLAELGGTEVLHLVGRDAARTADFAAALAAERLGIELIAAPTLAAALDAADAVVTLTTSTVPLLTDDLPADLLAVGVGAFKPQMAELPPGLLRTRRVIVDDLAGARVEAGDLLQAGLDWSGVSELADWLDQTPPEAAAPVFKSVGQAAWDLAAARVAVQALGEG